MPSPINVSRWQQKVRAFFGMRDENPVETPAELRPVVVVENDRPEWGLSGKENYYGDFFTRAGTAAEFTIMALVNRIDSGIIAVVEEVTTYAFTIDFRRARLSELQAASPYLTGLTGATVTEGSDALNRDFRRIPGSDNSGVSGLIKVTGTRAAVPYVGPFHRAQSTGLKYDKPIIIAPGSAFVMVSILVNTLLEASVQWRERPLERGILS